MATQRTSIECADCRRDVGIRCVLGAAPGLAAHVRLRSSIGAKDALGISERKD